MEQKGNKVGILVDLDRCVGCFACEVACRQENIIKGNGKKNIKVIEIGPKAIAGRLFMDYFPTISKDCTFCQQRLQDNLMPSCIESCPTKALFFGDEYSLLDLLYSGKRYQICSIKII
jgi:anaerobic dimethyl sulfoxide reductase subunit B (iron-sulfur subunit)